MYRKVGCFAPKKADATTTQLAVRYLFAGEPVAVLFFTRQRVLGCFRPGDSVAHVGNTYDPDRHLYDHKPPSLPVRYASCATRPVWEDLRDRGQAVMHLEPLANAVHAMDSIRHRSRFDEELTWSLRQGGFHHELRKLQEAAPTTQLPFGDHNLRHG